jgi:hypothetical protein
MTPGDACKLRRVLAGIEVNGELDAVSGPLKPVVKHLLGLTPELRGVALDGWLSGREDASKIKRMLEDADPDEPSPAAAAERYSAHLGDLAAANDAGRFVWPQWIVRAHFTVMTSDPKVGKTRTMMEVVKRAWFGMPWPDRQDPTFPAGTRSLWIPGDRHQDELRALAAAYGLPVHAVLLNTIPSEPYAGVSLDDIKNVEALRERVELERPGLVIIDTVWRATHRRLCREDDVNALLDPIIAIAQEYDVAIIGLMHASKDGETLGRRLEGLARAVIKLSKPDPDGQPARRKLWVDRANFLEPPPLGVTIEESGCDFDFDPPADALPSKGGRPPEKLDKAIAFLVERLSEQDQKQCELITQWEATSESKGTMFNAMRAMHADGRLVIDDSRKPKMCHLVKVKNPPPGQEPSF